jgi:hypothetical protein
MQDKIMTETMVMGKDIIDEVQKRQLIWSGHTNRMDETRCPRKVLKWVPREKCKHRWLRQACRDDIKAAMGARNLTEEDCYRREEWRLGAEKW